VLFVLSVLLLFRSARWLRAPRDRLARHEATSPLSRLGLLGLSVLRLVLPVLGMAAAARIAIVIGAQGIHVSRAVWLFPFLGLVILMSRWLAMHAFPPRPDTTSLLPVAPDRRREGRLHAVSLGVLLALTILIEVMADTDPAVAEGRGPLMLIPVILGGLTLIRLGHLLLVEGRTTGEDEETGFRTRLMRLLGRSLVAIGLAGAILVAVGYVNLSLAVIWPTVLSLGLLVVIGTAQSLAFDLHAAVTRRTESVRDALTPTLVGLGLLLAALPVFALIWGVRPQTLGEWWGSFLRGVSVGDMVLSPSIFLTFAVVFSIGYLLTRLVKGFLRISVLPKTRLDTGGTNAILSGTSYVGITLAALLAITTAGIDLSGLAIVAGALSVGVGFGLQTIVQNFVSGIILLIERPIKLGDWIAVNGNEGFVRQISVRSTRIETFDRQDLIVPNADLISGVVTNYTLGNSSGRVLVPVGVAYGTDTRRVEAILREITEAHPMVVLNPPPVITFEGFGADSQDFLIRAVLRDVLWKVIVKSEINHCIAERFREEGIEIPFAQRDVWLRNPETLQSRAPADPPDPNPARPPETS
ncbi:MAG: mechanosensitive ion channel domain-containing protein, partial [Jannaschia sp.]